MERINSLLDKIITKVDNLVEKFERDPIRTGVKVFICIMLIKWAYSAIRER